MPDWSTGRRRRRSRDLHNGIATPRVPWICYRAGHVQAFHPRAGLAPDAARLPRRRVAPAGVAVLLAVAALTAVGFFADRLNAGLSRDARQLLGGDAVVGSDQPPPPSWRPRRPSSGCAAAPRQLPEHGARARRDGRRGAAGGGQGGERGYPLRGGLRVRGAARRAGAGRERRRRRRARCGSTPRCWTALQLRLGDALLLGDATLRIARSSTSSPTAAPASSTSRRASCWPRPTCRPPALIQPASRGHRWQCRRRARRACGARSRGARVRALGRAQIETVPWRGTRRRDAGHRQPEMSRRWTRAEKFLNLVALLAALLSAVAVGIAARDFASRHLDDCAMLRVLGLSQRASPAPTRWSSARRPGRQRGRRAAGLRCTTSSCGCWPAW
jgi:putative ABC transport system permease protein